MSIFSKQAVGLDISDCTIEVVEAEKSGNTAKVIAKNRVEISSGIVENGRIKDEKKLAEIITSLLKEAKPKPIKTSELVFGLPDSLVYTYFFELGVHEKKEREDLVLAEAQKLIPLDPENLFYYYEATEQSKAGKTAITFFGADREVVLDWVSFFKKIKLEPKLLDLEALAVYRAVFAKNTKKATAIIDWGSAVTKLYLFDQNGLRESITINIGGEKITLAIMNALKLERAQAEAEKIKEGFTGKTKTAEVAKRLVDQILIEIRDTITDFSKVSGQKFSEIVIVGGSVQLPGLLENCQKVLGLPIKIGSSPLLKDVLPLEYLEALGLALRGTGRMLKEDEEMFDLDKLTKEARLAKRSPTKKATKEVKNFGAIAGENEIEEETEESANINEEQAKQLANLEKMNQQIQDKLHTQKIILMAILLVGVLAVALAFVYRSYSSRKDPVVPPIFNQFSQTQTVELEIPLAVEPAQYGEGKLPGRIIEDYASMKSDYDTLTLLSRNLVSKKLNLGEVLSPEPINSVEINSATSTPIAIRWATYQEKTANDLFLQNLEKINQDKVKYILSGINIKKIEATTDPAIYILKAEITVYAEKQINFINQ